MSPGSEDPGKLAHISKRRARLLIMDMERTARWYVCPSMPNFLTYVASSTTKSRSNPEHQPPSEEYIFRAHKSTRAVKPIESWRIGSHVSPTPLGMPSLQLTKTVPRSDNRHIFGNCPDRPSCISYRSTLHRIHTCDKWNKHPGDWSVKREPTAKNRYISLTRQSQGSNFGRSAVCEGLLG